MAQRMVAASVLVLITFTAAIAGVLPGDRYLDTKAQVLDIVFPLNVTPPYFRLMVLRFGDSDTQINVVTYPGGKSEMIRYSLDGLTTGGLSQLVSKMTAEDPLVTPQQIASTIRVRVSRCAVDPRELTLLLNELNAIKLSPVLGSRVALDESSEYEFWYDTWQESVHYTITGRFQGEPQDRLREWMFKFRARVPGMSKMSPARKN